jgi:hypothetical protein
VVIMIIHLAVVPDNMDASDFEISETFIIQLRYEVSSHIVS